MQQYAMRGQGASDVAMQLPTGSGKTFVGLLIGEWLRRKNNERVVFLCPTRQLVHQVVAQAEKQYGLSVHGFVGSKPNFDPTAKADYQAARRIAVTTYSNLEALEKNGLDAANLFGILSANIAAKKLKK